MRRLAAFALLLALAGCGALPHPFEDNPGRNAIRLSQPPPSRLIIPPPPGAMLTDGAADAWAGAVADALATAEMPALAGHGRPGEWQLGLTADLKDGRVVPHYTVRDPKGVDRGSLQGAPVAPEAWADGQPALFRQAAQQIAPQLIGLLTSIEARREQSDPNSLLNRPAQVFVAQGKGAPGDGNAMLTKQMRSALPQSGEVVVPDAQGADYTVQPLVHMAKGENGTQRVEIQWVVTDAQGREGGRILQLNEVPPGTLDLYWGDVAVVVAQQAAGGVRDVITNQLITHRKPAAATPGTNGTVAPAATAP